ncbi:MAG: fluoride efflux transporter CrcB [Myxococcaceae bacterium]
MTSTRYLLVALGGAVGSMGRYFVGGLAPRILGQAFPYGTLLVNVFGSFFISLVMGVALNSSSIPVNLRLFLTTGILGGFTTYSTFNYETLMLLQQRLWLTAGLNLVGTLLGCLVAGVLGLAVARLLVA